MSLDAANVALAPHLYETELLIQAIEILETDRDIYFAEARRFGMHHPYGRQASRNARRISKMVRACRKAL